MLCSKRGHSVALHRCHYYYKALVLHYIIAESLRSFLSVYKCWCSSNPRDNNNNIIYIPFQEGWDNCLLSMVIRVLCIFVSSGWDKKIRHSPFLWMLFRLAWLGSRLKGTYFSDVQLDTEENGCVSLQAAWGNSCPSQTCIFIRKNRNGRRMESIKWKSVDKGSPSNLTSTPMQMGAGKRWLRGHGGMWQAFMGSDRTGVLWIVSSAGAHLWSIHHPSNTDGCWWNGDETENDEEWEVWKHLKPTPKPLGITSSWGARRYQASFKRLDQRSIDTN